MKHLSAETPERIGIFRYFVNSLPTQQRHGEPINRHEPGPGTGRPLNEPSLPLGRAGAADLPGGQKGETHPPHYSLGARMRDLQARKRRRSEGRVASAFWRHIGPKRDPDWNGSLKAEWRP
ncbi:hypothetical protein D3C79_898320 [compost metagenome]